jgi:hypothetical protein
MRYASSMLISNRPTRRLIYGRSQPSFRPNTRSTTYRPTAA